MRIFNVILRLEFILITKLNFQSTGSGQDKPGRPRISVLEYIEYIGQSDNIQKLIY